MSEDWKSRAEKAEAEALALALECKSLRDPIINFMDDEESGRMECEAEKCGHNYTCAACKQIGLRQIEFNKALSRPASFWTRKAEAMGKVVEAVRKYFKFDGSAAGMQKALADLDSIGDSK